MFPGFAAMVTDGTRLGFTTIMTLLLVAGLPVAQGVAFDVRITFTTSALVSDELVKAALLVPVFTPFTCH
jgi:hypothetical protein